MTLFVYNSDFYYLVFVVIICLCIVCAAIGEIKDSLYCNISQLPL